MKAKTEANKKLSAQRRHVSCVRASCTDPHHRDREVYSLPLATETDFKLDIVREACRNILKARVETTSIAE
jgi:hypothetical protein